MVMTSTENYNQEMFDSYLRINNCQKINPDYLNIRNIGYKYKFGFITKEDAEKYLKEIETMENLNDKQRMAIKQAYKMIR